MAATRLARGCSHLRVEPIQIEPYEPGAVDAVVVRFAYGKNGFAKKTKMISDMGEMGSPHMGTRGVGDSFLFHRAISIRRATLAPTPRASTAICPIGPRSRAGRCDPAARPPAARRLAAASRCCSSEWRGGQGETMRDAFENMGCNLWSTMGCDMWGEMPCGTWKRMGGHMGRSVTSTSLHSRA